jgi:acetyl esterase/lipase
MWDLEHVKYACIRTIVNTSLYIRHSSYLSPGTQPDQTKTYPCRPNLFPCRIFKPKGHDGQNRLPLVIRAHGGGFVSVTNAIK